MSYNLPFRKIFIEDAISIETTGASILNKRQSLAKNLHLFKQLSYVSTVSVLSFAYLTLNKKYTNRQVYLYSLFGSIMVSLFTSGTYMNLKTKCIEEFGCKQDELTDYAWFYNYSINDLRR